jgi:hypothetical protein
VLFASLERRAVSSDHRVFLIVLETDIPEEVTNRYGNLGRTAGQSDGKYRLALSAQCRDLEKPNLVGMYGR